jgi:hypothetical protein
MKLEKWALIAEIIGGVAVVFSLIYVGFQVAQNTQAIRINTVQQSLSWILNESEHILLYEDLRETMLTDDLTSLSPTDRQQHDVQRLTMLRVFEYQHFLYAEGQLDDGMWLGLKQRMMDFGSQENLRIVWDERKTWFNPRFREFMEGEIFNAELN